MKSILTTIILALTFSSAFALKPSKTYTMKPDTLQMPYETNIVKVNDSVKLQSWTFLPNDVDNKKTTIILAYADAGNMSSWLMQGSLMAQVGFTVVMFDYRGFGASSDFKIDSKMLYYNQFADDLTAMFQFARKKYPDNKKTGVWAFSMGTIATTLAYEKSKPDFIIGDGYVVSPKKIKQFYEGKRDPILLPADADKYEEKLKNVKANMLVFSGSDDKVTPYEDVMVIKGNNAKNKIIQFKGGHMAGFSVLGGDYPGQKYMDAVVDFLKKTK